MSKPYDAVGKVLVDGYPADWLEFLGIPGVGAEPVDYGFVDTDLSTVTSQADRVLRVVGPEPRLEHIEFESGHHGAKSPPRMLCSCVLLNNKFDLPVRSSVVLVRPEADSPALTGELPYYIGSARYLTFQYHLAHVWRLPVDSLLAGGMGTLPLTPLADVSLDLLPNVMSRLKARVEAETSGEETGKFWTATKILMGLRYSPEVADDLQKGVRGMKVSTTYQAILGRGARRGLIGGPCQGSAANAYDNLLRTPR